MIVKTFLQIGDIFPASIFGLKKQTKKNKNKVQLENQVANLLYNSKQSIFSSQILDLSLGILERPSEQLQAS